MSGARNRIRPPHFGFEAAVIKRQLADRLPGYAMEHFEEALVTDTTPDAVLSLVSAAPNEYRGWIAVLLYLSDVPLEAFQEGLRGAWNHDHRHVRAAARTTNRLMAMFKHGGSPLPPGVKDTVRIWRGGKGCELATLGAGPSWSLSHDIACWFAMRWPNGDVPLVLAADVPRGSLLHYDDERAEQEVICFRPAGVFVDGAAEDWETGLNNIEAARTAA
jgi:hypothetical protein